MGFNKKIFLLSIFLLFISVCCVYSAVDNENIHNIGVVSNETDLFGCCSIVLQENGTDSILAYRRDSNLTADIHIEKINWHGIPAIKQYKTEGDYFTHVIITNNGWIIGLGGIDDGVDNQKCENITATMISKDNNISEESLAEIQKIKQPYGRGHVVVKAPNGNYGFANVDKLKTGKLEPGQYISIPNNYSNSRSGNISLNVDNKIKVMNELSQTDTYGVDRREIITYDFQTNGSENITDIYVSNEDGSFLGKDYTKCIDDIYFGNNVTKSGDIPIAPNYKSIGSVTFTADDVNGNMLLVIGVIILALILIIALFIGVYKLVLFIKSKFIY